MKALTWERNKRFYQPGEGTREPQLRLSSALRQPHEGQHHCSDPPRDRGSVQCQGIGPNSLLASENQGSTDRSDPEDPEPSHATQRGAPDMTIDQRVKLIKEMLGELLAQSPMEQPISVPGLVAAAQPANPASLIPVGPVKQNNCQIPELKVTFRGKAEQLRYFLTQVWNFMAHHGLSFLDDEAKVNCMTVVLEGEVANWVISLHDVGTKEFYDFDYFMFTLR